MSEKAAIPFITQKLKERKNIIFFRWYPDILSTNSELAEMIDFKPIRYDFSVLSEHYANPDPKVSKVRYDSPAVDINVLANKKALDSDASLRGFYRAFKMTKTLMDDLVLSSNTSGAYPGACEWLRKHNATWKHWLIEPEAEPNYLIAITTIAIAFALLTLVVAYITHMQAAASSMKVRNMEKKIHQLSHQKMQFTKQFKESLNENSEIARKVKAMVL